MSSIFGANRALSRTITTSASTAGAEFPYFSVPAWEAAAYESRQLAGFETVTYAPVAQKIDRWLNFTQQSRGWLDESKRIYDDLEPGLERSSEPPTGPLPNVVWNFNSEIGILVPMERNGLMVPSLHTSPPPLLSTTVYQNVDMFSNPEYRAVSLAAVELKGEFIHCCFDDTFVSTPHLTLLSYSPHCVDSVFSAFDNVFVDWTENIIGPEMHQTLHENVHAEISNDRRLQPHSIAAQRKKPTSYAAQRYHNLDFISQLLGSTTAVYKGLSESANSVVGKLANPGTHGSFNVPHALTCIPSALLRLHLQCNLLGQLSCQRAAGGRKRHPCCSVQLM